MGIEERVQQRTIDGFTYEVTPVTAAAGYKALLRFMKLASPVLSAAMDGGKTMEQAAAAALSKLATTVEEGDLLYFAKLFGPQTKFCEEGKESSDCWATLTSDAQELHFAARYMAMFDWLKFCMEVNFGGFFGESIRRATAAADQAKKATKA